MAQPTNKPTVRHYDFAALVRETWGEQYHKPEPGYEFSNERKFDDSGPHGGIYDPS